MGYSGVGRKGRRRKQLIIVSSLILHKRNFVNDEMLFCHVTVVASGNISSCSECFWNYGIDGAVEKYLFVDRLLRVFFSISLLLV